MKTRFTRKSRQAATKNRASNVCPLASAAQNVVNIMLVRGCAHRFNHGSGARGKNGARTRGGTSHIFTRSISISSSDPTPCA